MQTAVISDREILGSIDNEAKRQPIREMAGGKTGI